MAVDRRQGRLDLNAKLRAESGFRRQLANFHNTLARQVGRQIAQGGRPNLEIGRERLELMIRTHMQEVGDDFSRRLDRLLPDDLKLSADERGRVDSFLSQVWTGQAASQADLITATNQADAERALAFAQDDQARLAGEGALLSTREMAINAGLVFRRLLRGREEAITCTETQIAAETAKQVEAQVAVGQEPLTQREARQLAAPAVKEWVTMGDSRVRPAHIDADSEQVPVDAPFQVGGEFLMYPGDTSLGATPGNVINCRCSAVTDVVSVATSRQDIVGPQAPQRIFTEFVTLAIDELFGI